MIAVALALAGNTTVGDVADARLVGSVRSQISACKSWNEFEKLASTRFEKFQWVYDPKSIPSISEALSMIEWLVALRRSPSLDRLKKRVDPGKIYSDLIVLSSRDPDRVWIHFARIALLDYYPNELSLWLHNSQKTKMNQVRRWDPKQRIYVDEYRIKANVASIQKDLLSMEFRSLAKLKCILPEYDLVRLKHGQREFARKVLEGHKSESTLRDRARALLAVEEFGGPTERAEAKVQLLKLAKDPSRNIWVDHCLKTRTHP